MKSMRNIPPWLAMILIGIIATAAIAALFALVRFSDGIRQGEVLLAHIREQASRLNALEWQAIADHSTNPKLLAKVEDARNEFLRLFKHLDQLHLHEEHKHRLRTAWETYNLWLNQELRLIEAGHFDQAKILDEEQVDPAFAALDRILGGITSVLINEGKQARAISFVVAVIIIFGAGLLIGLLLLQNRRSFATTEVLRAEQRIFKNAGEKLQIEKNKLDAIIGAMTSCLTIKDRDYNIIYQSPLMTELFGNRTGEKCYQTFRDFQQVCDGCAVELAFRDGKSHTSITEMTMPDGKTTYWENVTNPIRDFQGEIVTCLEISTDITERKLMEMERLQHVDRLRKTLGGTIQVVSRAVEMRDPYTAGHQRRAADLARAIATAMGFSSDRTDFVRIACTIHDIGKISVPAEILSKPTILTDIEFSLIKGHVQAGYDILKNIEFPWPVADVILQHHERMDGSGYPQGIKGDDLLLESRILAVADVVESMASHRPYRSALGIDAALEEITKNRGTLYDPWVVDICLQLFNEKNYKMVD